MWLDDTQEENVRKYEYSAQGEDEENQAVKVFWTFYILEENKENIYEAGNVSAGTAAVMVSLNVHSCTLFLKLCLAENFERFTNRQQLICSDETTVGQSAVGDLQNWPHSQFFPALPANDSIFKRLKVS